MHNEFQLGIVRAISGALSHDLPCQQCGHGLHTFLPCSDLCGCPPVVLPGQVA